MHNHRTHRERKAEYIKALEKEISTLRESYYEDISAANSSVQQHKQAIASLRQENDILKRILSSHGIPFDGELDRLLGSDRLSNTGDLPHFPTPPSSDNPKNAPPMNNPWHTTGTPSLSPQPRYDQLEVDMPDSHEHSTPQHVGSGTNEPFDFVDRGGGDNITAHESIPGSRRGVFEEDPQLQVDFVLAYVFHTFAIHIGRKELTIYMYSLEAPCREHTEYLCRESESTEPESMPYSGHALMASCPPPSHISKAPADQMYPHKTYDLPAANLSKLLNLSRQLVIDGQVTPIMALQYLKSQDMYRSLTRDDVRMIIETLNTKIRCYGFGAVLEDFELMDCLTSVVASKCDHLHDNGFPMSPSRSGNSYGMVYS